jgi:hypothetical protein
MANVFTVGGLRYRVIDESQSATIIAQDSENFAFRASFTLANRRYVVREISCALASSCMTRILIPDSVEVFGFLAFMECQSVRVVAVDDPSVPDADTSLDDDSAAPISERRSHNAVRLMDSPDRALFLSRSRRRLRSSANMHSRSVRHCER